MWYSAALYSHPQIHTLAAAGAAPRARRRGGSNTFPPVPAPLCPCAAVRRTHLFVGRHNLQHIPVHLQALFLLRSMNFATCLYSSGCSCASAENIDACTSSSAAVTTSLFCISTRCLYATARHTAYLPHQLVRAHLAQSFSVLLVRASIILWMAMRSKTSAASCSGYFSTSLRRASNFSCATIKSR